MSASEITRIFRSMTMEDMQRMLNVHTQLSGQDGNEVATQKKMSDLGIANYSTASLQYEQNIADIKVQDIKSHSVDGV